MARRTLPRIPAAIRHCEALPNVEGQDKDWVYAYYDRDGDLLYIGVSNDPAKRASGHRSGSKWWRFVADGEAIQFDLSISGRIEREAIDILEPTFNIHYSTSSSREIVEYCARREAWDLVDYYLDAFSHDEPAGQRPATDPWGARSNSV